MQTNALIGWEKFPGLKTNAMLSKKEKFDVLTCSEHQQLTLPPPLFIPA
jgi:hypothetical protein